MQYVILGILTFIKILMKTFITKLRIYDFDEIANVLGSIMDGLNILITGIVVSNYSSNQELFLRIMTVVISGYIAGKIAVRGFEYFLHRIKEDETWIYFVMPKNISYGKEIADSLRNKGLEVYTLDGYYDKINSLFSIVISKSKEDSSIIKQLCSKNKCKKIKI